MWMARAGEAGVLVDDFRSGSFVAIGWTALDDITHLKTREQFSRAVDAAYPGSKRMQVAASAGQAFRFVREMKPGDRILTYDPGKREYLLGTITGDYTYRPSKDHPYPQVKAVKWEGAVQRDRLSVSTRNSLGAIATLFQLPPMRPRRSNGNLQGCPRHPHLIVEVSEEATQVDLIYKLSTRC